MSRSEDATRQPTRSRLRPGRRLLMVAAAWLVLGLLLRFVPPLTVAWPFWPLLGGALAILAFIDAWRLHRERPGLQLERSLPPAWPLNGTVAVELVLRHQSQRPLELFVHDLFPDFIRARDLPQRIKLEPGKCATISWRATSTRRGDFTLDLCHVARRSPAGLWWQRDSLSNRTPFRVYPNFNLAVQYGLLAGDRRLEDMGIHLNRKRGSGSEFEQLREYREGDSMRQIDWAATARTRKLISREYQEERNQSVMFLLDKSHRMRAMDGDLSHFDHSLNAMLLLSHVALKQGDEVGLHTLADEAGHERMLPPGRGQRQYSAVLETTFDLEPGGKYPDFAAAGARLLNHQRRRSLVIVLTNLRDGDQSELLRALVLVRRRHLVILADLRERIVGRPGRGNPHGDSRSFTGALLEAGCALYREQRKAATARLRQHGIIHLDVQPDELPAALVSKYRQLKAGGML